MRSSLVHRDALRIPHDGKISASSTRIFSANQPLTVGEWWSFDKAFYRIASFQSVTTTMKSYSFTFWDADIGGNFDLNLLRVDADQLSYQQERGLNWLLLNFFHISDPQVLFSIGFCYTDFVKMESLRLVSAEETPSGGHTALQAIVSGFALTTLKNFRWSKFVSGDKFYRPQGQAPLSAVLP